jgi:hypothetical protein
MDIVPGWAELVAVVGAEPEFADAAILDFSVTVAGEASLTARTFVMPDGQNYDYDQALIVTIEMRGLEAIELDEFAPAGATIEELKIKREGSAWVVSLESAFGMHGTLRTRELMIRTARAKRSRTPPANT